MRLKVTIPWLAGLAVVILSACSGDKPQSSTSGKSNAKASSKRLPVGWFETLGQGTWKEDSASDKANILIFSKHRYFVIRKKNWVVSQGKIIINHDRGFIQLFNKNGRGLIRITDWSDQGFKVKGYLPMVLGNLKFNSHYKKHSEELDPPIPNSLLMAAKYGDFRAVKGFLNARYDIEKRDKNSMTPLALAVHHHHTRVALYLLEKGANVKSRSKNNKSILEYAMEAEHVKMVEKLLEKDADINYKRDKQLSLFLRSLEHNSLGVVKLLVKHGANVYELDNHGYSSLYRAMTTFDLAKNKIVERFDFTHYLVDKGGYKAHTKDKHGRTALFYAANLGLKRTVSYFLAKGVDPNQKDNNGQTVYDYIAESDKKKLVWPLLIKHKQ